MATCHAEKAARHFLGIQVLHCIAAAQLPVTGGLKAAVAALDPKALQLSEIDEAGVGKGESGLERVLLEAGAMDSCLRSGAKPYAFAILSCCECKPC